MLEYREVPLPSFEEFLQARDLLKTNSAPGTDEVPPGFLACLIDDVLHNLFWERGYVRKLIDAWRSFGRCAFQNLRETFAPCGGGESFAWQVLYSSDTRCSSFCSWKNSPTYTRLAWVTDRAGSAWTSWATSTTCWTRPTSGNYLEKLSPWTSRAPSTTPDQSWQQRPCTNAVPQPNWYVDWCGSSRSSKPPHRWPSAGHARYLTARELDREVPGPRHYGTNWWLLPLNPSSRSGNGKPTKHHLGHPGAGEPGGALPAGVGRQHVSLCHERTGGKPTDRINYHLLQGPGTHFQRFEPVMPQEHLLQG